MPEAARIRKLKRLENKLGTGYSDLNLLHIALIHRSYSYEHDEEEDNERLEFLGDAVLDLIVSSFLYHNYPKKPEGELAQIRAAVVNEKILAEKAGALELGDYILLGRGELRSGGTERVSILADAFEALIGSLYLDAGLEETKRFVLDLLGADIDRVVSEETFLDYKSLLQEETQKRRQKKPVYRVVEEIGPDHCKEFMVNVYFDGSRLGSGRGKTKKKAQKRAARRALHRLKGSER